MKLKKVINKTGNLTKSIPFKKKWVVFLIIIVLCIAIAVFFVLKQENTDRKDQEPNPKNPPSVERNAPGGDPMLVISYYDQAVAAWRAGDKDKAKELAKKGLNLSNDLTPEQLQKIPSQANLMFDLYDLSKGSYEEN